MWHKCEKNTFLSGGGVHILCSPAIENDAKNDFEFSGLEKNFNQWDPLIDGQDDNLIKGTNVTVLQSSIWTAHILQETRGTVSWMIPPGAQDAIEQSRKVKLYFSGISGKEVMDRKYNLYLTSRKDLFFSTGKTLLVNQCLFHEASMLRMSSWTLCFHCQWNLHHYQQFLPEILFSFSSFSVHNANWDHVNSHKYCLSRLDMTFQLRQPTRWLQCYYVMRPLKRIRLRMGIVEKKKKEDWRLVWF